MENGKQKLFQPSDFDKDVTNKKRSHLFSIIIGSGFIVIVLVAIFFFIISPNNVETNSSLAENKNNLTENIVDSTGTDNSHQLNNSDNKEIEEESKTVVAEEPMAKVEEIQKIDNKHSLSSSENYEELPVSSIEEQAHKVIRGDYGNGLERKQKLGDKYTVIQNKVNEMYREGLVD